MDFNSFDSSNWPNLIYYILLLALVATGVFTRRDITFGKTVKYLAIWFVIAIVLLGLYSYRYEFSDFKTRIASELNPSKAQLNQDGKIIINISQDGHFYTNAKINGVDVRFMIDTGASDIAINLADAKRIGIDLTKLNFNRRYQTANGVSFGAAVILEKVEIVGVKFEKLNASVNNANMGVSLLGMSFLKRLKKYEVFQDQLILTI